MVHCNNSVVCVMITKDLAVKYRHLCFRKLNLFITQVRYIDSISTFFNLLLGLFINSIFWEITSSSYEIKNIQACQLWSWKRRGEQHAVGTRGSRGVAEETSQREQVIQAIYSSSLKVMRGKKRRISYLTKLLVPRAGIQLCKLILLCNVPVLAYDLEFVRVCVCVLIEQESPVL